MKVEMEMKERRERKSGGEGGRGREEESSYWTLWNGFIFPNYW